jgi:hypothetical protein
MAKTKETKPAATAAGAAGTPATPTPTGAGPADKAARAAKAEKDVFVFVKDPEKKVAPQAQNIINLVKAAGKAGLSRADLVKQMKGVVQTRQPEGRILTYYQKLLTTETGALTLAPAAA